MADRPRPPQIQNVFLLRRHGRIRLPRALHLRDVPADVGAGAEHLHGVLLQPLRLARHIAVRLRAGVDALQAQGRLLRLVRAEGPTAAEDLQGHRVSTK